MHTMLDAECMGGVSGHRWLQVVTQMSINENTSICWTKMRSIALLDWSHTGASAALQRTEFNLATTVWTAQHETSTLHASLIRETLC